MGGVPEGDTVKNSANALTAALGGQTLTRSDFRVPALATTDLAGWTVRDCISRGKHLLLRLTRDGTPDQTLHSHLRMDGAWRTFRAGARIHGGPAHTIRVILTTPSTVAVGFHLHDLALVPSAEESSLVGHLGPDLLGPDWNPAEAVRRLQTQPDRTIGEALLDQRNLAGTRKVLFLRGVWPWRTVADAGDLTALVTLARKMLASNVGRWTQATTGSLRKGETNYVYGRPGRPCLRCGTLIKRRDQGSDERVTFWCPSCQPE
jgi:endonuclease VIII